MGTIDAFQRLVWSPQFKQNCFPHRSKMGVLKSFLYESAKLYGELTPYTDPYVRWCGRTAWEVIPCLLSDFRRHPGRFRASCGSDASLYAPIGRVLGKTRNHLASPLSWAGTGRRPSLEGRSLRRRRIEAFWRAQRLLESWHERDHAHFRRPSRRHDDGRLS